MHVVVMGVRRQGSRGGEVPGAGARKEREGGRTPRKNKIRTNLERLISSVTT